MPTPKVKGRLADAIWQHLVRLQMRLDKLADNAESMPRMSALDVVPKSTLKNVLDQLGKADQQIRKHMHQGRPASGVLTAPINTLKVALRKQMQWDGRTIARALRTCMREIGQTRNVIFDIAAYNRSVTKADPVRLYSPDHLPDASDEAKATWGAVFAVASRVMGDNDLAEKIADAAVNRQATKPYGSGRNAPKHVPAGKRRQWTAVWNAVYKKTGSEEQAFQVANGVSGKMGPRMVGLRRVQRASRRS